MKKILHVIPTLKYGGISSVVCSWHDTCHGSLYQFDYVTFNDGPLKEKFIKDGSQVTIIPTMRQNPIAYIRRLVDILSKGNYDGIHIHNSFKNGLALLVAKFMGVKLRVCHSHTAGLEDKKLKNYLPALKWLAVGTANTRLACGHDAGSFLYGKKYFQVVNNTINIDRINHVQLPKHETMQKYGIPDGKILIGHVGRFSSVKNHGFIVDIADKLSDRYHFVLVGAGPAEEQVQQNVVKRGLTERFTFVKPTTEIPELLHTFDKFILPSLFEGVSLALLEAQAASLECLASDRIPRENDIGLGLVTFLSLDNVSGWVEEIIKPRSAEKNREEITRQFDLAGYTNASLAKSVQEIYG